MNKRPQACPESQAILWPSALAGEEYFVQGPQDLLFQLLGGDLGGNGHLFRARHRGLAKRAIFVGLIAEEHDAEADLGKTAKPVDIPYEIPLLRVSTREIQPCTWTQKHRDMLRGG